MGSVNRAGRKGGFGEGRHSLPGIHWLVCFGKGVSPPQDGEIAADPAGTPRRYPTVYPERSCRLKPPTVAQISDYKY